MSDTHVDLKIFDLIIYTRTFRVVKSVAKAFLIMHFLYAFAIFKSIEWLTNLQLGLMKKLILFFKAGLIPFFGQMKFITGDTMETASLFIHKDCLHTMFIMTRRKSPHSKRSVEDVN